MQYSFVVIASSVAVAYSSAVYDYPHPSDPILPSQKVYCSLCSFELVFNLNLSLILLVAITKLEG